MARNITRLEKLEQDVKKIEREYDAKKWLNLYYQILVRAYQVDRIHNDVLYIQIPNEYHAYIELTYTGHDVNSNRAFQIRLLGAESLGLSKSFPDFSAVLKESKPFPLKYGCFTILQVIRTIEMLMDKVATYRS